MNPFLPPLMRAAPRRMAKEEVDAFARRAGWVDDLAVIDPATSAVETTPLPWWEGVELITARDPGWPETGTIAAWMLDEHLHRLDGKSPVIHTMNAKRPPRLDENTVLPYLGFFCFFVRAGDNPFAIIETADDALFPTGAAATQVAEFLRPTQLLAKEEDGHHCEAIVWYLDSFFLANFVVRPNGMVEMTEDDPLIQDTGSFLDMPLVVSDGKSFRGV